MARDETGLTDTKTKSIFVKECGYMEKIETVKLDTSSGAYINALKQIEYAIASASVRGIDILKLSCEDSERRSVCKNMQRAVRYFKKAGKIHCFVFGDKFGGNDDTTRYLLEKAEYIKDDADFEKNNEEIAIVYVKTLN